MRDTLWCIEGITVKFFVNITLIVEDILDTGYAK